MHYEFVAPALSLIAAGLSYWSYLQSKKHSGTARIFASTSQLGASSATAAATVAAVQVQSSGYKVCGTCRLTVARYEVDATGKVVCANCTGSK